MDRSKEDELVKNIFRLTVPCDIRVSADAAAGFAYAKQLSIQVVERTRILGIDVQPSVCAEYIVPRVSRFLEVGARAAVVEEGIALAAIANTEEQAALAYLNPGPLKAEPNDAKPPQGIKAGKNKKNPTT